MPMLTDGAQYATEKACVQHLFAACRDVFVQKTSHPLRPAKLQPGVTLGLRVGAPGHRGGPGWCGGAARPFSLAASHAA